MHVTVNGTKIYYQEDGAGEGVILIHGFSDNANLWIPLVPYLSKDYRVVSIDLRGHGHSGKPVGEYSLEIFTEDLLGLLDNMNLDKVNLIGHSLGAAIAQNFAINNPQRVNKLILLSPFSYVDNVLEKALIQLKQALIEEGYFKFFDEAVELVNTSDFIKDNIEIIETIKIESQKINNPKILEEVIDACLQVDIQEKIPNIAQKTLIIAGNEDKMIPIYQSQNIHEKIKNSEMMIIDGVGHNLFVMDNLEKLSRIMFEFLKK